MHPLIVNVKEIYREYFPNKYSLSPKPESPSTTIIGSKTKENLLGREVFLPIELKCGGEKLVIPCATIRVTGQKTIIRTAISERRGTVKEQFSVGDYEFSVNGVLISQKDSLPDEDMLKLKRFFESTKQVELRNAVSDLFLDHSCQVCITALEFPEVQGKTIRHRPFSFTCESDYVSSLIMK